MSVFHEGDPAQMLPVRVEEAPTVGLRIVAANGEFLGMFLCRKEDVQFMVDKINKETRSRT